ncbi:hypothetical protein KY285_031543 [Solanum tuberosum]|uniref:uncharacterized protein LOC125875635 n=1 Tax=Solanum stenotomum TaxID=172797 RepID=UPI001E86A18C|nr:uncharacterized protein LOC125875635 [Solanum stenotomum]KAH0651419.1 hypothetical protein KY284_031331 [Solanum tuberosum]KAH0656661.1 hypothetical protein KY285_031543 [Solanum tuberosum]
MASKLLMLTIFVFDLIAFGLAIAAERRRSTSKIKKDGEGDYSYCVYDSDIATGFGVGAFLFLMLSQIIIMVASRCFCCGKALRPGGSRACAVLLFIICWVAFFIAEVCLLAGSVRNAYHTKYRRSYLTSDKPLSCETLRKGVFAAGAAFIFFTSILSQFYYVTYAKARGGPMPYGGEAGVGMAAYK